LDQIAVQHRAYAGYAADLPDAKRKLRAAFERWLEWAEAMPKDDLKYLSIAAELKTMNAASAGR
jgi:hypothetical protein